MKSVDEKIKGDSDFVTEWYNLAVENAPDMVFIHNSEGKITYVNETGINESGYSLDELLNMNPVQLVPPEYYKILEEIQVKRLNGNMEVFSYEMEYLKKGGGRISVSVSSSPIIKDGKFGGVIHVVRNISEIKKAEKLLLIQSELNLKLSQKNNLDEVLWDVLDMAVLLDDVDCGGIYVYDEGSNEYQLKVNRNLSKEYVDLVYSFANDPKYAEIVRKGKPIFLKESEYQEIMGKEVINLLLNKEKIKSVAIIPFFYHNKPLGNLSLGSHNVTDISSNSKKFLVLLSQKIGGAISRIKAEESLKESEEKYRQLVESANSIIFKFDKAGKIITMNEFGLSFFGYTHEEIIGKTVYETITPEYESTGRDLRTLAHDIHQDEDKYRSNINENIKKNGERVWIYWANKHISDNEGNLEYILAVGNDITEQRKLEEMIRQSELKFKTLFEKAYEPVFILDKDLFIQDTNLSSADLFHFPKENIIGMSLYNLIAPLETKRMQHALRQEFESPSLFMETIFIKNNGQIFPAEINLTPLDIGGEKSVICTIRDTTEQKRKEDELKKQILKYELNEGNLYLSKEPSHLLPFEAFRELVDIGYKGILISRSEKDNFDFEDIDFDYFWLSARNGQNTVSPDIKDMREFLSNISNMNVIMLDSIDHLIAKNGFNEIYNFVSELREMAYFGNNIIILSVDKDTIDSRQLKLIEKEAKPIILKSMDILNNKMLDIIIYIFNQNKLGVNPSYSSIGKELTMTRPTVRKNVRFLEANKFVIVHRKGRNKKLEITEKGKKLL